jgi:hypothetical protein
MTPGSSIIARPELRCRHGLRRGLSSSALPIFPQSVSRGAHISGLPDSRICYGLPSCSPPLYGSDRCTRPPRAFTSRLPTDRSPSPLLDISTTATGLLCWRDSRPLEWQLASLHQTRMCRFPASGSSWKSLARGGADDTIRDLPAKNDSREEIRPRFHSCQFSYPLSFRGQVCEAQGPLPCFPSTALSTWHPAFLDRVPVSPVPRCHRYY